MKKWCYYIISIRHHGMDLIWCWENTCFILISNVQTCLRLTHAKIHWQWYIWSGMFFFWMCVHLLWSAGGYWPTYANWLPSSRENYSPRPLDLRLLALSFWDVNVLYKDKLFWMIRETLFVKVGFYPNGKAPSRNFDNNVPFSTEWWRGFSFFFTIWGGGLFNFF